MADYESMKVAQLRALCQSRGIECDGRKDELIALLQSRDDEAAVAASQDSNLIQSGSLLMEPTWSSDDLRALATVADEMKHLRRQWLSQVPLHGSTSRK